ncbi:MAG: NAAT family transporter [Bauldia sp.]|jgi:multiple antibiotic resistance protein|nr:MAG: NAAT family transporter [Bauldia sp.]
MSELIASFLTVFVGLFPIVNPLGMAPIFLRLTSDATAETRAQLARKVAIGGFILMAVSLFIGSHILAFFGLTITAVQIAGGLVVMAAGWRMLQQGNDARVREQQSTATDDTIMRRAFFPLTMPLTVGPGTISVAITLGTRGAETTRLLWTAAGGLLAALAVALAIYLSYRFAASVLRRLGETGTDIFMRLSAFILLCLGVQIVTNGLAALPFLAGT